MAIAYVANSSGEVNGTDITVSHVIASGSDRLLLVGVETYDGSSNPPEPTCTYNSVAMTKILYLPHGSGGDTEAITLFGLVAPTVGTANIFADQGAGGSGPVMTLVGVNYTGVDQTTPWDGTQSLATDALTTYSVTVTSAVGDLVVGFIGWYNQDTIADGTGVTTRKYHDGGVNFESIQAGERAGLAGATAFAYTFTSSEDAGLIAVNLNAVAAAATAPFPPFPQPVNTLVRM